MAIRSAPLTPRTGSEMFLSREDLLGGNYTAEIRELLVQRGVIIVRGANPGDSGTYFDGVEIPLLYHFGGLTSVVNAEFLEDIAFYPGGFGAYYGRATAGIVADSVPEAEWNETRIKAQAVLRAAEMASAGLDTKSGA